MSGIANGSAGTRFPQTTLEPATAWMRDALTLFERQSPLALAALVVTLVVAIVLVMRVRAARAGVAPSPALAPGAPPTGRAWPWTVGAFALVAAVVAPALLTRLAPPAAPEPTLRIEVVGHQWWWEARYPDHGFATATDVHVPLGRPVELAITSADVMHSLWIPAIGPRHDVPPGRRRIVAFTPDRAGVFAGQCVELCGASHANMHLRLFVDEPAAFDAWLANQRLPARPAGDSLDTDPVTLGQRAFERNACRGCHTVRGVSEGPIGPDLTHFASRTTIAGGMFPRNDSTLSEWLLHADRLKQGSTMPGFKIPQKDLVNLVRWLQSLE